MTLYRLDSQAPEETQFLAEAIGREAWAGLLIALKGDLGSGKTTFVRGLAVGLGSEDPVTSPTFTLHHLYRGRLDLSHLDAWMAEREAAFLEDGGQEWLAGDGVAAIEWAEKVQAWLPEPHLEILFEHGSETLRRLTLRCVGEPSKRVLDLLGRLSRLESLALQPIK